MTEDHIYESIDKYLSGEMLPEEKLAFEARLQEDEVLMNAYQLQVEIDDVLKDQKAIELEQTLETLGNEFAKPSKNVVRLKRQWLVAASLALVVGIGALLYIFSMSDSQNLYNSFYEPYSGVAELRSVENTNSLFKKAVKLYKNNQSEDALSSFENLLKSRTHSKEDEITLLFYKGLAQLELNQTDAQSTFESLLKLPTNEYTIQSKWYLALILVKNENFDAAKLQLLEIKEATGQGKYFQLADRLLNKIDS